MRRLLALSAALALGAPALAAPGTPIDLAEVRQNLFSTCFASDRDGWMVGELGRIIRTTDGGKSWVRQDAGTKRPFLAMSCLDAKTAWVAGKEGIVYGTKDGGETWTTSRIPENVALPESALDTGVEPGDVNLYGLSFGDPDHVWIVGEF